MTTQPTMGGRITDACASPWRLGNLLDGTARTHPWTTALITGDSRRPITYAVLAELVDDHCTALRRCGLRSGDVIALQSSNSIEFVVALLGAARANLVVAPLDPTLPWSARQARADRVGARVIVTDARLLDPGAGGSCPEWGLQISPHNVPQAKPVMRLVARDSARAVAAFSGLTDRDALIMFTSGTTGSPKLVPWTHENIAGSIKGIASAYNLSNSDATVAVMPLFHGHGLVATLLATLATGGAVALPAAGRFSAHTFWADLASVDATWYTAVPTIHQIVLGRVPVDLPGGYHGRLRFVRSCSAPLPAATAQRMEATVKAPVLAAYGMTETTHQASTVLPGADLSTRLHAVGTPTGTGLSVRIVDHNGVTCPPGTTGEIWLRGPTVVRGYLDSAVATASTFVDGWVRSGDLGAVDGNGNLTIHGRIKELINRGGEKISPEHVEDVLMAHRGVEQAAVFGIPDTLYGERVAAVVVPRKRFRLERSDLAAYCSQRLAKFEIPERITFVDELPLTAKGSVDRSKLALASSLRVSAK